MTIEPDSTTETRPEPVQEQFPNPIYVDEESMAKWIATGVVLAFIFIVVIILVTFVAYKKKQKRQADN